MTIKLNFCRETCAHKLVPHVLANGDKSFVLRGVCRVGGTEFGGAVTLVWVRFAKSWEGSKVNAHKFSSSAHRRADDRE